MSCVNIFICIYKQKRVSATPNSLSYVLGSLCCGCCKEELSTTQHSTHMDTPKKAVPGIKETSSSTFNIANCSYTYSIRSIPIMNYKFNSSHNSQVKHGDVLYTLDAMEQLTTRVSTCLNIDSFSSTEELLIWMTLAGYIIPLVSETNARMSKMFATISLTSEQHTRLLKKYFKIVPILQVPKCKYPRLTAEYFKWRFPLRTKRIKEDLLYSLYSMDEWIKCAVDIFTDFSTGHSVSPSIFVNDSAAEQWIIPPYHALLPEALQVVTEQLPIPYTSMTVADQRNPMQCQVCRSNAVSGFAYKHCGCRATFYSCFHCALREWYSLYFFSPNAILDGDHVFVACSSCHMNWSLVSLLYIQANQSWFRSKAQDKN